jgi:N-acetylglutamate synthase-like GNAT family acetyltransferase/DNA-binding MarR family transcriptional regulator
MQDVLKAFGPVFLGSRLKRLGEKMQSGAAQIIADAGLPVQPTHMPLLAALNQGPMTIGQLVDAVGTSQPGVTRGIRQLKSLGLVGDCTVSDMRQHLVSLTPAGAAAMARATLIIWPRIEHAVSSLCASLSDGRPDPFLDQITRIEAALAERGLADRATGMTIDALTSDRLTLREFSDGLAVDFHDINAEWITAMFRLEATDKEVLENPKAKIIDTGGQILFVEAAGLGIVGACALQKTGATSFELTKMGVRESARGLKAGEFLLKAMIARANDLGANPLYLLTNSDCAAAIHLYEKFGFRHDRDIMAQYGVRYERCNVAMRYFG